MVHELIFYIYDVSPFKGVILCFAVDNRASFDSLEMWKNDFCQYALSAQIFIVGLKSDCPVESRAVSKREAVKLAHYFIECL